MPSPTVVAPATRRRLVAPGALLLVAVSGCEEQEAEPLTSSLPTAALLLIATAAALWWLVRRSLRRLAHPASGPLAPLRFPRSTAALLLGPVLVAGIVASLTMVHEVAVGYRNAKSSPLSYGDTVVLAAILAVVMLVLVAIAGALAVAATSTERSARFTARGVVAFVVVALAMIGVGLVWLPALVVMLIESPATPTCVASPSHETTEAGLPVPPR